MVSHASRWIQEKGTIKQVKVCETGKKQVKVGERDCSVDSSEKRFLYGDMNQRHWKIRKL